ncbi:MAG: aspartate carbamoyltransferase [Omnitrophica WOR_2 bacterium GWF2_38_59]|nr:MAG: aspartate carbamoyltransferase [Omnitrophica WOR_2 bacterium GWA2_37_7]OGX24507.1 MAG: aspartate carbamoyltransferase [Omnitrophica WOR_2 bacterium GWF2_38_59]OGX54524.1 MAG: aspartate carbamoyltransferase [Omnitrophica WOR_2 bacterium RIFOXYA12_FULL_38_10]OGX54949.1 MAG: aspartate carbamoyltransferase [Omnitrophica WOR_2 bacterium RIFOXYC2_FULL_38_12]OGX60539.1 MAG: aspartate carbamoyltransferase [Omnitrophica WOR_2 bacterium RIFOXYB2_FULL_38_16]HBG62074.1 aspartate carbamoyltransfera
MAEWTKHSLLDLKSLSVEEIEMVLETAKSFKEVSARDVKKVPALRGKTVVMLFFEPSTRTRTSFELAAKRLSADTINIAASSSALSKGETILDMAKNIEAMNVDAIIVRHSCSGVPLILADNLSASIINAGDGCREHPTQALLDMFTINEKLGRIKGLNVSIVGDISNSRVARSNIWGLTKLGANVTVCGPSTMIPFGIEKLGVKVSYDIDAVIPESDVLMLLRIQKERQNDKNLPSIREYAKTFGVDNERLKRAKREVLIMHPGPTNRGVELSAEVADGEYSVILNQVTNGVAIRMAVLYLLLGIREPVTV